MSAAKQRVVRAGDSNFARWNSSIDDQLEDYVIGAEKNIGPLRKLQIQAERMKESAQVFESCLSRDNLSGEGKKCVYFIRRKEAKTCKGIYKIGMATNLKGRLSGLQVGSLEELTVAIAIYHKRNDLLEKQLHETFKDKRVRGEWFDLDYKDFQFVADMYGDWTAVYDGCPETFE